MRPDSKSSSFTFHKNILNVHNKKKNCCTNLQERFDDNSKSSNSSGNRSVLSIISLDESRRVWRNGAERMSKTFSNIRTTIGSLSQRLRIPTRRRQILEEGPMTPNCATPQTHSRRILGRTPTKLYSPFGIDTPGTSSAQKENLHPNRIN